ncbi:outer membrane receptor protein involved in Fe transport [Brevundimonas alba]|uniref:Outer membrane receptor protein involved in Fe transport n=1 Tax=Brevundimonas alba TaxID=74314 RepID=A0A7X5YKQ6_9CAUL|nr:TonB-dependent receptor [Brevundimonas alba]NJC41715.1 outer membrane receptor protein involved in Fe transport [Brevundimonas alba]
MRLAHLLRTTVSSAAVGACAFGLAGVAAAQDQQTPTTIDDIVVTAQKREQNLQDVPIVVTSLSAEALNSAGVRDIKDLQIITPGLVVTSNSSEAATTARIRGVGTVGDNPGLESSVGVVIDGVYRSRNSVGFGDLGELSRIEVLKGPQGTLFGKNTSAGVINIITEAPSFTPGFNGELTGGNYGAMGVGGSVTGPLSDSLAFRLYAGRRLRNGFYSVDTGDGPRAETDDSNQDFGTVRGQLLWLPSDSTSVRVIADYSRRDEHCCTGVQVRTGPTYPFIDALSAGMGQRPPAAGFGQLPYSRQAFANRASDQEVEDKGVSVEMNVDLPSLLGGAQLTSITSARRWTSSNGQDSDYTGADIAYRINDGNFGYDVDNLTQEFRLAGKTDTLDWLVGAFATREDIDRGDAFYLGADYSPLLSLLLSSSLNAANPALPVSPATIGCYTRPGQTAAGFGGCLATGGMAPAGPTAATGPSFTIGQTFEDDYQQKSTSIAAFTNNTWHVTDRFDVTLGLRYTIDDKSVDVTQRNTNGNGATCSAALANAGAIAAVLGASAPTLLARFCLPWTNAAYNNRHVAESFDDGELSGTLKVAYRFSPELMVYASGARGYKSFGYNLDRVQTGITPNASLLFPSEVVDSYEFGFKSTLFNRTVLLNATYFDQTFEDFQLNTFLGTSFVVESIPELTSKGVDADFMWFTPVEGLSLQGGLTYIDARYGQFTAADLANPANYPQLSLLPGSRASFSPEWSGTASINFNRSLGDGLRGGFSLAAKYTGAYNTGSDLLPFKVQDAFATMNGRIVIGTEDERWTLEFWAQNLTDEEYVQVIYNGFLQGNAFASTVQPDGTYYNPAADTQTYDAFLGQPRTFGATLRVQY